MKKDEIYFREILEQGLAYKNCSNIFYIYFREYKISEPINDWKSDSVNIFKFLIARLISHHLCQNKDESLAIKNLYNKIVSIMREDKIDKIL
jgi:hypothetical protein